MLPGEVSFEEAERMMGSRIPMTRDEFYGLDAQMRLRAFTVARLTELDAIDRVRRHLLAAMQRGRTLVEYMAASRSDEIMAAAGFDAQSPWYWETVYRNNMQSAYNAGRAMQVDADPDVEYLEFIGIEDARQTDDICRPRTGVVLPKTDPWWDNNWPPLHHNCRSTVRAVYPGETIEARPPDAGGEPPQDGWGAKPTPTGAFYKLTPGMVDRAKAYGVYGEISEVAQKLGVGAFEAPQTAAGAFLQIPDATLRDAYRSAYKRAAARGRRAIDQVHAKVSWFELGDDADGWWDVLERRIHIGKHGLGQPGVLLHEFGHAYNDLAYASRISDSQWKLEFAKDAARIAGDNAVQARIRARLAAGWGEDPNISDLFAAVTNNEIKGEWGHSASYFAKSGNRESEAFANLFEIRCRTTPGLWAKIRQELPNLVQYMASIVK